ncbi:ABC transporter substrate-binding protein [Roseomonas sp. CCTCC AB2023176]|uniref:ABC transporter substrate-binding protein n=1 Tax=Roseomonas sp. CCTCC AB2023176 TaxID=3342640 RepID=UPI0035DDDB9C
MNLDRRGLLALPLAGALPWSAARAQARPFRIGVLTDMSGPFRDDSGPTSVAAVRQAIEDFGAANRGLNVEVLVADHQNRPDVAVSTARQWFDRDGVDAVVDLVGSAVALAVAGIAREKDKVCIVSGAGTADLTGPQCSPNTVHYAYDTWMLSRSNGGAMVRAGGDTWFFVTADYAFGHALQRDTTAFIEGAGGRVVGSVRHPFPGTTDFASYLQTAIGSRAKVLGIANAGADCTNTIKQAAEFRLTRRGMRMVGLVMVLSNIQALGLETAQGLNFTETFYWDLNDRTRALSARLAPKIGGGRMNMLQAGSYGGTMHLLRAVADLGPEARASGRAIVERMKAVPTDDDAFGQGRVREDGRKLHPAYLLEVKSPAESRGPWDYCKVVATTSAEEAFRPAGEGGCTLVRA